MAEPKKFTIGNPPPLPMRDEAVYLLIEYLQEYGWAESQIVNLLEYISIMTNRYW